MVKLPIVTSRSHVESFEKCPRLRFWRFEYEGIGLEPSGDRNLRLDARIGTAVHDGVEFGLQHMGSLDEIIANGAVNVAALAAGFGAGGFSLAMSEAGMDVPGLPAQQRD